jgi:hypothetical protein
MKNLSINLAKKRGQAGLVEFVFRDRDHGVVKALLNRGRSMGRDVVELEKQQRATDPHTFVAIKKALRLREVESVAGGDIKHVTTRVKMRIPRRGQRRFEQSGFTESGCPAVTAEGFSVKIENFRSFEEVKHCEKLLGEFAQQRVVFGEYLTFGFREAFLPGHFINWLCIRRNNSQALPDAFKFRMKVGQSLFRIGNLILQNQNSLLKEIDRFLSLLGNHTEILLDFPNLSSRIPTPATHP